MDQGHDRISQGNDRINFNGILRVILVGIFEAILFEFILTESPNNPDPGQAFTKDQVDTVGLGLHRPEERDGKGHD